MECIHTKFDRRGLNSFRYRTRVFIGESNIWRICLVRSNWQILYWRFELLKFLCLEQWLCGRAHVVINGNFNVGEISGKLPIANINSSPINRLVWYFSPFRLPTK